MFDIADEEIYLTRLEDNKYKLEVGIKNPDMIYSIKENQTFDNLKIDVEFSLSER